MSFRGRVKLHSRFGLIFKIPGNSFGDAFIKAGLRDISQGGGDFCGINGVAAVVAVAIHGDALSKGV
jgi:hypothetical protein